MKTYLTSQFLINKNAIAKNITRQSVDFYNPNNNTYLGSLTRIKNNSKYRYTSITTFDDKLQKIFCKTVKQYFDRIYLPGQIPNDDKFIPKTIITEIIEKDYTKGTSRVIVKEKVLATPLKNFEYTQNIKYSPFKILKDIIKPIAFNLQ